MGIHGLSSFIQDQYKDFTLTEGTTVYVDGNNIRFQLANPTVVGRNWNNSKVLDYFHKFFSEFLKAGVKLRVYLDGCMADEKSEKKKKSTSDALERVNNFSMLQKNPYRANLMKLLFELALKKLQKESPSKVEIIQTPFEADGILSCEASIYENCAGILTNDSDFFLTSEKPILKATLSAQGQLLVQYVTRRERVLQKMAEGSSSNSTLTSEQVALLATLCPNDYNIMTDPTGNTTSRLDFLYARLKVNRKYIEFSELFRYVSTVKSTVQAHLDYITEGLTNRELLLEQLQHAFTMYYLPSSYEEDLEKLMSMGHARLLTEEMKQQYKRGDLPVALFNLVALQLCNMPIFGERQGGLLFDSNKLWTPTYQVLYSYVFRYMLQVTSDVEVTELLLGKEVKVAVPPFPQVSAQETSNPLLFLMRLISGFKIDVQHLMALIEDKGLRNSQKIIMVLLATMQIVNKPPSYALCLALSGCDESILQSLEHSGVCDEIAQFERGVSLLHWIHQLLPEPALTDEELEEIVCSIRIDQYKEATKTFVDEENKTYLIDNPWINECKSEKKKAEQGSSSATTTTTTTSTSKNPFDVLNDMDEEILYKLAQKK